MKVIFNADDFGHSKGVNLGIIEAHQNGVVQSTTMMAGMDGFDHAASLYRENPDLKIGVHLTLTAGKSVGGVYKTITDENGNFLSLKTLNEKINEIDLEEVEKEYEAQIQKILSAGIEIDHLDSHHHTHNLGGIINVFIRLAKKYNQKTRCYDQTQLTGEFSDIVTTDHFDESFYDKGVTFDHIKKIIAECQGNSLEIMCHPAYVDYTLYHSSAYNLQRIFELQILTSDELKDYLTRNGIQVCTYSDL